MKTPDKIYIQNHRSDAFTDWGAFYELEDGTVLNAEFHLKALKHESIVANIEYIRKDALLEWANEQIKVAKVNNLAYSPFEKLIDKLNSME